MPADIPAKKQAPFVVAIRGSVNVNAEHVVWEQRLEHYEGKSTVITREVPVGKYVPLS